jgi:hypothetical protein
VQGFFAQLGEGETSESATDVGVAPVTGS